MNWMKWGSPLDFGHHAPREGFSTNPVVGLSGLLISPGKGSLFYAPVVLLPVLFSRRIRTARSPEFFLTVVVTAVYLGIYGLWYDWGGLSWGLFFGSVDCPMDDAGWTRARERLESRRTTAADRNCRPRSTGAVSGRCGVSTLDLGSTPPKPFSLTESNIVLTARRSSSTTLMIFGLSPQETPGIRFCYPRFWSSAPRHWA